MMAGPVYSLCLAIVFYVTFVEGNTNSRNILILPISSSSYIYKTVNLAKELKTYGYNITVVLADSPIKERITKEIDADVIVSDAFTKSFGLTYDEQFQRGVTSAFTGSVMHVFTLLSMLNQMCQNIGRDKELITNLRNRHFDVVIINMALLNRCASVIPHQLSVPFIRLEVATEIMSLRSFLHPAVYPVNFLVPGSVEMSYIQRLGNTLLYLLLLMRPDRVNPPNIIESFAPEAPLLTNAELEAKTELFLITYDELIDYHFPVYPNMILVGGLSTRPASNLTEQLESFMNTAQDGAVIVSLGSVITWLPDNVKDNIIGALRELPLLKFIFKYGNETKIDGNVMLLPWIPQNDLLGHHNTKLFITHCGANAYFEALYHAVPMIGLPVFGDQYYNAGKVRNKGYGVILKVYDFTKADLISAIDHVISTPSYTDTIYNASVIFKNRPQTPAQRAAWWVDHVIKYGGKHMRPPVASLPFHQYLLVDVIAGILIILIILCLSCFWSFKCICKACRKTKPKLD